MNPKIVEQAKKINADFKKDVADFEQCLRAGICPICGSNLALRLKTVSKSYSYKEVFCFKNHKLIHPKFGERNSPGCLEYKNCANKEIEQEHRFNYGDGVFDGLT